MSDTPMPQPAQRRRFYSRSDSMAGGIAGVVAFAGYVWTLAPSVTLEDSGEFLTAAYSLGVPHPPGYPIWTILAWIWWHLVPFGNIAWRLNLMSAFFSALACGLAALLISRSGHAICTEVGFLRAVRNKQVVDRIVMSSAICAGLLLAFSPVMWSQAVITEVYGLNAFFLMATLVVLYRWSFETDRRWRLYLAAFIWGVGMTAHQTLVLLTVAFPVFIWFADRKLGRDVLVPILAVIVAGVTFMICRCSSLFYAGVFSAAVVAATGIAAAVWLWFLWREGLGLMRHWPQVLAVYAAVLLGLSLYSYVFFASCTNPPMNWGHCSTWEAFKHHFGRGQYEKLHTERSLLQMWGQVNMFFDDLQAQFNIIYALLALLALFFFRDLAERDRHWLKFLLVAFLFLSAGFIFLSNPGFEKQKQFTDRVFFLPCHCIYALWIGYGLILGLGYAFAEKPQLGKAAIPVAMIVLLLPVVSVKRNWADNEQRHHDFGYRFGYLMFKPGGGYPEMDADAVLFGGTDPGRFVPTYLIFAESFTAPASKSHVAKCLESGTFDRRDVRIITQNALADSTYMAYLRDQYGENRPRLDNPSSLTNRSPIFRWLFGTVGCALGRDSAYPKDPIWVPSAGDMQVAFAEYVEELKTRELLPGEDVKIEAGRVSVQGVTSVMAINNILAKKIFDHNKAEHSFYVEESYMIPWMYPYMEPYGVLLKMNHNPVDRITGEMVKRDRDYWDALVADLRSDAAFTRDDIAQKSFSKLRLAIGGLYAYRSMLSEAEYAFQQAIQLCPDSPEGYFRLAQLYVEVGRFDDGTSVLNAYEKLDPFNSRINEAVHQIQDIKRGAQEISQLEKQMRAHPNKFEVAVQLAKAYAALKQVEPMDRLVNQLVSRPELPEKEFLQLINCYMTQRRLDHVVHLLTVFVHRYPKSPVGWYNLAVMHSLRGNCDEALAALERALALDTEQQQIRMLATQDTKLTNCRTDPRLQRLLEPKPLGSGGLPFVISH